MYHHYVKFNACWFSNGATQKSFISMFVEKPLGKRGTRFRKHDDSVHLSNSYEVTSRRTWRHNCLIIASTFQSRYIECEKRRFLAKSLHVEDQNEIVIISNSELSDLLFFMISKNTFQTNAQWMFSGIFVLRRKHVAPKLSPVEMIFCEKLARIAHQKWSIISQKLLKSSRLRNNSW